MSWGKSPVLSSVAASGSGCGFGAASCKGIADPAALQLLKGFNFNERAVIGAVLYGKYSVDPLTGIISLNSFTPINDLAYPAGATHVTFRGAYAVIDFATGVGDIEISPASNMKIDGQTTNISLNPPAVPAGTGTALYLMMIEFFQEVNGVQYSLKNGAYNVLAIVDAA